MRAFRVAYDGRPFHGFQRQPDVPTVEDTLLAALRDLDVLAPDEKRPPGYSYAGRTDRGVSAVAQTVAFEAPEWCTARAFNSALPGAVRAWATAEADEGFHARHRAQRRGYTYHLYAPAADRDRAAAALSRLSGEHDFHNFTPDSTGTVRDVSGSVERDGEFLVLRIAAGGFPKYFVRRLVSVVAAYARGDCEEARLERVLSDEGLSGPAGIEASPPEPLVMTTVEYPGLAFTVDDEAAASARDAFAERRVRGLERSRVAGSVLDALGPD